MPAHPASTLPTALIVDDDPGAILTTARALQGLVEVCFATSVRDAMQLMATRPVDLLLLDGLMPEVDGFDACPMILAEYPDLPVLFVTAAADHVSEVRALSLGAVDFITKPVNPHVVRLRVATQLKLKAQADELRAIAVTDALTKLANRRALDARVDREWETATHANTVLSLMLIDIDYFKRYNDLYGHVEGDACLQRVAASVAAVAGAHGGLAARYGGEEFALLLPGRAAVEAVAIGETVAQAVRDLGISHSASSASAKVSVSVGVGSQRPAASAAPGQAGPVLLFRRADQALYEAKVAGRNRVCVSDDTVVEDSWMLAV